MWGETDGRMNKAAIKRPLQQIPNFIRMNTDLEYNSSLLSSHSTLEPAIQTLMLCDVECSGIPSDKLPSVPPVNTSLARSILPSRTTNFVQKLLGQILQPIAETNHGEFP